MKIIGIDFSGAKNPESTMWIAEARLTTSNLLYINSVQPAKILFLSSGRDETHAELVNFIKMHKMYSWSTCIGLDFPFSIPEPLMNGMQWKQFITHFPKLFKTEKEFRNYCRGNSDKELKRGTDIACKTPFSPYNLRLFRQTYYGIKNILNPLLDYVSFLPMDMNNAHIKVVEICPASTLKSLNLYIPYKGKEVKHKKAREQILNSLERMFYHYPLLDSIIEDTGGDALDSIIAAYAVWRNMSTITNPFAINCIKTGSIEEGAIFV